ncbi:MAG: anti-sigma factor [Novosphingobium sp.]
MTITPEEIMAYVDGELDEAERNRVTLAALADMDLAEKITAERALRERLTSHFAAVVDAPVPAAWEQTIRDAAAPEVIDLAAARQGKAAATAPPRWRERSWMGAALAASLVLGVFVGGQWQGAGNAGPIVAKDGVLRPSGTLATALDVQLASDQTGAPLRIVATFQRTGGDICRTFSGPQASGIACRDKAGWQLEHLMPGSIRNAQAYQQAGSHDAELMELTQNMAAGEPLDPAQERKAKARGWR